MLSMPSSSKAYVFKSSVAHPEWYAGQLAAYSKAVEALTGIPQSRISARLVKVG